MRDQATARKYEPEEERNLWEQYEQRKAELENKGLTPSEYLKACRQIAEELGI